MQTRRHRRGLELDGHPVALGHHEDRQGLVEHLLGQGPRAVISMIEGPERAHS